MQSNSNMKCQQLVEWISSNKETSGNCINLEVSVKFQTSTEIMYCQNFSLLQVTYFERSFKKS